MSTLELKAYEIFKTKLGETEANTILEWIEEKSEKKIADKKDVFLTKDDKVEIIEKLAEIKSEMIKWMFIFWMGAVGTLAGIMFILLHSGSR
jgi:hypothetical protein